MARLHDRPVYHLVPRAGRGWELRREGAAGSIAHFSKKENALAAATAKAKQAVGGRLVVHGSDGAVQSEIGFGDASA